MDDKLARTIGDATRAARQARKLTQEDAADVVGVSVEFYARIERGKTLPSVPTLLRLAAGLRVSADVLLGLDRLSEAARVRLVSIEAPDAAAARKMLRRIQRARPSTLRLVNLLLREIELVTEQTQKSGAKWASSPRLSLVTTESLRAAEPRSRRTSKKH
jgi:transcriptional regulator with XRE-family HTH domain